MDRYDAMLYKHKALTVAHLEATLSGAQGVSGLEGIDYRYVPGEHCAKMELVRVRIAGVEHYINVTGNSELSIITEVLRLMNDQKPVGLVTAASHDAVARIWAEAVDG